MIPVNVVTGFLGSGKTTLLKEVLSRPEFSDTAVIVNEFGEVGLDHILLEEVSEGVLLLDSGCLCCTIRSDLQETIRELYDRAKRGEIPEFRRVVVETTGLADPTPVVSTIVAEPVISKHFRTGNIICTVEALAGTDTLARHPEAIKQVAVADRILVTKCDLADTSQIETLEDNVDKINPTAATSRGSGEGFDADALFALDLDDDVSRQEEVSRWLDAEVHDHDHEHDHHHDGIDHIEIGDTGSFVLRYDLPIDWTAFGVWLTALLHAHGERVLRVKGILNVAESDRPVVINGVQHVVHPPLHLRQWPTEDHTSRIVFITQGISEARIRNSLSLFLSAVAA
ncbi:MAG: GTP-binding protein [Pseudomonadota bacterium]